MTEHLIKQYKLKPHPEGGHYREIYSSVQQVDSPINKQTRSAVTQIYYLLQMGEVSRFHKVIHDEIWHHYAGAPLTLYLLNGESLTKQTIGGSNGEYTAVVQGDVYQAATSTGEYSLVGCTVAPGFHFDDFTMLEDKQLQIQVLNNYPDLQRFL